MKQLFTKIFLSALAVTAPAAAQTMKPTAAPATAPTAAPAPAAPAPATTATTTTATTTAAPAAEAPPAGTTAAPAAEAAPPPVVEVAPPPVAPVVAAAPIGPTDDYANAAGPAANLTPARERTPLLVGLLWDMSLPVGSSSDFASNFSAQGFALDFRYWGLGKIGFGALVNWDTMADKKYQVVERKNVTLSGVTVTELNSSEFVGKLYVSTDDHKDPLVPPGESFRFKVAPYAAFGFGGARVVRRVDIGSTRFVDESWHWAFVPEVGVELPLRELTILAATRFNYLAASGDGPEQLFMNFSLGAGF